MLRNGGKIGHLLLFPVSRRTRSMWSPFGVGMVMGCDLVKITAGHIWSLTADSNGQ